MYMWSTIQKDYVLLLSQLLYFNLYDFVHNDSHVIFKLLL